MSIGYFSPDKKHWWDGGEWRQVSADGKWWWDDSQWRPLADAPVGAPESSVTTSTPQKATVGAADAVEADVPSESSIAARDATSSMSTSVDVTNSETNDTDFDVSGAPLTDEDDTDADIEAAPDAAYRLNPMGLIVSPRGEWWWASRWSELVKKPVEAKPKEKGPKLGFSQAMQMVTLAQEMKKAIGTQGSVAAVEASLKSRADARVGIYQTLQATCPLPLNPGMPLLPGGIELFPDEFLVATAKDWGVSSQRLTITTHRIIYTRGRASRAVESVYLQDVRDVKYVQPVFSRPRIGIETASGLSSLEGLPAMGFGKGEKVRNDILAIVHFARQHAQAPVLNTQQPAVLSEDVPAKLKQLAELHKSGILTDEEFQTKKADLLTRM